MRLVMVMVVVVVVGSRRPHAVERSNGRFR